MNARLLFKPHLEFKVQKVEVLIEMLNSYVWVPNYLLNLVIFVQHFWILVSQILVDLIINLMQ
jgi:hypothetical protein